MANYMKKNNTAFLTTGTMSKIAIDTKPNLGNTCSSRTYQKTKNDTLKMTTYRC